jgi:hypothetical protein
MREKKRNWWLRRGRLGGRSRDLKEREAEKELVTVVGELDMMEGDNNIIGILIRRSQRLLGSKSHKYITTDSR